MSNRKTPWTPGKWELGLRVTHPLTFDEEINIYPPDSSQTGGYQYSGPVAVVSAGETGDANARLIAKAPEMAELLAEYDDANGTASDEWLERKNKLLAEIEEKPNG